MEKKNFDPAEHFMPLKGKNYLQVMWRLVWFREDHPDWMIHTEMVEHVPGEYAVFKASIVEPHTEQILSTGYGSESKKDFGDFLEKAETKAVGRALAMLGYGTQFAPELDEEDRIVDSPVPNKTRSTPKSGTEAPKSGTEASPEKTRTESPASEPKPEEVPTPKAHCKMCGAPLYSSKDGVAKKSQSGELVYICNECNAKLKKNADKQG